MYCVIHSIKIYPVDSVIHSSNNWSQAVKQTSKWRSQSIISNLKIIFERLGYSLEFKKHSQYNNQLIIVTEFKKICGFCSVAILH